MELALSEAGVGHQQTVSYALALMKKKTFHKIMSRNLRVFLSTKVNTLRKQPTKSCEEIILMHNQKVSRSQTVIPLSPRPHPG